MGRLSFEVSFLNCSKESGFSRFKGVSVCLSLWSGNRVVVLFYFVSSFPGLVLSFGFGGVPSRYLSFVFFISGLKANRKDLVFIWMAIFALLYPLIFLKFRPFHLLDLSYVLGFFYVFLGVTVVRKKPESFKKFVSFFWVVNICFAVTQNIVMNVLDEGSSLAMFHQNSHRDDYVVPAVTYLTNLYRVTGLFVESAPFVIYLMFTHCAFVLMGYGRIWIRVNLFCIFFAGAKIGIVFLLMIFLIRWPFIRRINALNMFIVGLVIILSFSSDLLLFVNEHRELRLGSVWVRLNGLMSTIGAFLDTWQSFFIGSGYVSGTELMEEKVLPFRRGIDFFSTFIIANGVLGSCLILMPLFIWLKRNINLAFNERNLIFIVSLLALLTMGSLLSFQYAYLVFILTYISTRASFKEGIL
jgi:hypothetical protein